MFAGAGLPAYGPDLSISAYLQLDGIKWSGRSLCHSEMQKYSVDRGFKLKKRNKPRINADGRG
jgi:hypothetical protein